MFFFIIYIYICSIYMYIYIYRLSVYVEHAWVPLTYFYRKYILVWKLSRASIMVLAVPLVMFMGHGDHGLSARSLPTLQKFLRYPCGAEVWWLHINVTCFIYWHSSYVHEWSWLQWCVPRHPSRTAPLPLERTQLCAISVVTQPYIP